MKTLRGELGRCSRDERWGVRGEGMRNEGVRGGE